MKNRYSARKNKELGLFKIFIPYEKGVPEKLKGVSRKYGFTTVSRGHLQARQKNKMETSDVAYEVACNNCLK